MSNKFNYIKIITVAESENFLNNYILEKANFFAYFYGEQNPKSNKSWCSDCNISHPLIDKQLFKIENKNIDFLKFPIETRAEWKNPQFTYRLNMFKISRIPTLIFYKGGNEMGRLKEAELFDEIDLNMFFEECIDSVKNDKKPGKNLYF